MKHYLLFLLTFLSYTSAFAYDAEVGGVYYNFKADGTASVTYVKRYSTENSTAYVGRVEIPEKVMNNDIEYTVTTIESYAFYSCSAMTSVELPATIKVIDTNAFNGCSALESIVIPHGVSTVSGRAFANCTNLKTLSLPTSLRIIDTYAFQNCSSLEHLVLPEGLTTINNNAFVRCSSLVDIVFPQTLIALGETKTFFECTSLREVHIPDRLTLIPSNTFEGCSALEVVYLGKKVNEVAGHAFFGCPKLHDVYCYASTRPTSYTYTFEDFSIVNVHVDNTLIESFHSSINWGRAKSIMPLQCATPTVSLDGSKLKFTSLTNLNYAGSLNETFSYAIETSDVQEETMTDDDGIDVLLTYTVHVKGSVPGCDDSEENEAQLCWLDREVNLVEGNGIITDVESVSAQRPVLISSHDGQLVISGLSDGELLHVYAADGRLLGTTRAAGTEAYFQCSPGQSVILRIGHKAIKAIAR